MSDTKLKIIPLGGCGEIGANLMVVEYDHDIIVIDAGLMFPENEMLGIDIVIPDIAYLVNRRERVRGIVITHGHEDHIGALPYILPRLNVPVYATRLTRGLIEIKLKEAKLLAATEMHTITTQEKLQLGVFNLEFIHVCHSIPDAVAIAVHTPVGTILHSSDYKFDPQPVDGWLTETDRLQALGDAGVLMLLSDSTNAETSGFTPSEAEIGETFQKIFAEATGRVIVATFASNISRIQQLITISQQFGRRIGVIGRSMVNNVKMSMELGYLNINPDELLSPEAMNTATGSTVTIICTGSQGEPTSALVRMAMGEHRTVEIRPGDTMILSATPIPGNEEMVLRTVDNLFRLGAEVYYHELFDVHVSGHGSREDHKNMLRLVRPKFFVPIHGEYRHLVLHARLAEEIGIAKENTFVIESGTVLEVDENTCTVEEKVTEGHVLVDGLGIGDIGSVVLRDRRHLSQDGFLVAIVGIDQITGELLTGPEILSRGFVYMRDSDTLIDDCKKVVTEALSKGGPPAAISHKMREVLAEFCYARTHRRPLVLPVVMEI